MTVSEITRRPRKNTIGETVKTYQDAQKDLPEPIRPLSEAAQAFFQMIVISRESSTWSPYDLASATMLAEVEAQIVDTMQVLQREGRTVEGARGLAQSPEIKNLSTLNGNARSLATQLGLSAAQRALTSGSQALRSAAELDARRSGSNAHSSFA